MPLVLSADHYGAWLDSSVDPQPILKAEMTRSQTRPLDYYPSNPVGNSGRFEGPEVIERVLGRQREQLSLFDTVPSGSGKR
jgi:putative SOS response-associated peptidase YedK